MENPFFFIEVLDKLRLASIQKAFLAKKQILVSLSESKFVSTTSTRTTDQILFFFWT
jgi:hypothetical protein